MLPFYALNNPLDYYATFIVNNECSGLGLPCYFSSINHVTKVLIDKVVCKLYTVYTQVSVFSILAIALHQ